MSIATEISRIQQAKADIKSSIEAKGVTVPSAALIDDYSDYVDAIQTGGGGDDSMEHYLNNTLTSYTIPAGITSLHNYCFSHLTNLKSLTLNNDLTTIGKSAFEYSGIEDIIIPASVTSAIDKIFANSELKRITFKGATKIGTNVGDSAGNCFYYCQKLEKVVFEDNIDFGGYQQYESNNKLTTAGTIGSGCSIEYHNTDIQEKFFSNLDCLKSVQFNTGCSSIGIYAFNECFNLRTLDIPSTVNSIGNNAFSYCCGLYYIKLNSSTPPSITNYNYQLTDMQDILVPQASISDYVAAFPLWENRIFANTHTHNYSVTQLRYSNQTGSTPFTELNDTVLNTTNVSKSNLKRVYIGNNVTEIGNDTFSNVYSVFITDDNSLETIGNSAFSSSYLAGDLVLPNVVTISNNAFRQTMITSVTFGNNLTSIGNYAFQYSHNIKSVTIPDSVTSIGDGAFTYMNSLESLTIGSGVTSMGNSIVKGNVSYLTLNCSNIPNSQFIYHSGKELTLGATVTSIGNSAFERAVFDKITCLATTPPTAYDYSFNRNDTCPIYVPAESVEAYKAATGWSVVSSRIQAIPTE